MSKFAISWEMCEILKDRQYMTYTHLFTDKWHSNFPSYRLKPNLGGLFRDLFWGWRWGRWVKLTLIWADFLEVWGWGGRGVKLPPPPHSLLKLVRIMLETSNLARKYTHISSAYLLVSRLLLMSAFFGKNSAFLDQSSTFTQSNKVRARVREF